MPYDVAEDSHIRRYSSVNLTLTGTSGGAVRAAPLVRAKVKITVKNVVCEESSASTYGVFDWEFGFDSQEWSCSHDPKRTSMTPGMQVRVVNSYAATALSVLVIFPRSVDLPTEGNPTKATRASPDFWTSNPSPYMTECVYGETAHIRGRLLATR